MGEIPALPPYATGALYFLRSGDFLFRYRNGERGNPRSEDRAEGAKFVTMRDVRAAFGGSEADTGWINLGVIRCGYCAGGNWFAFIAGPQKVSIHVVMKSRALRKLTLPIPATVLVGVGKQYFIWATKSSFGPEQPLYHAPFPNVHTEGTICWGQNTPPEALPCNATQAWQLFFESTFNGDLSNGKSAKFQMDVRRMLSQVTRKKLDEYPEEDLIMANRSLSSALRSLVGPGMEDG